MVTSAQCLKKYGNPVLAETQSRCFELWIVPDYILKAFTHVRFTAVGTVGFPKKIFINKDFKPKLIEALTNVINRGLTKTLLTWDGCFMIRKKVSGSSMSLHSWAIAIDINREWNDYGHIPTLPAAFIECFTDAGLDWGGTWKPADGMHFQLSSI